MTIDQIVGAVGGAVGVLAMLNSLRKTRIDDRTSAVEGLQVLCEQLQTELKAVKDRSRERETELQKDVDEIKTELTTTSASCTDQIEKLTARLAEQTLTIERQAHQLTQLDRRERARKDAP
jgi:septal ring factor EnvC (AmiA/AmiB activator)